VIVDLCCLGALLSSQLHERTRAMGTFCDIFFYKKIDKEFCPAICLPKEGLKDNFSELLVLTAL
jgi:hypothetical protein